MHALPKCLIKNREINYRGEKNMRRNEKNGM